MKSPFNVKQSVGLSLVATSIAGCAYAGNQQGEKPNIVIVLADDLGWGDVGYHGSNIMTPNLDKLSQTGIQLNRFYVASISTPTRAGLLTGKYPNRFGVREVVIPPWRDYGIQPSEVFLPEELAKAGYKNRAIIGKWHLGHSRKMYYPLNQGFTHFYGHLNGAIDYFTHEREGEPDWHNDWESSYDKGYSTDLITDHAVKCIKEYSKDGPFFMYVAYNAPHGPLQAKDEDLKLYGFDPSKPRFGKDKTGHGNNEEQTFAAMVTCMDRGIGEIIQTLKDAGKLDNTIFLFFSDNGTENGSSGTLRGKKFLEFDGGVRSPALLSWPAQLKGGRTINQVMGFVDVMPTMLSAANKKTKVKFDGMNMLPVLKGEKQSIDRKFYLGLGAVVTNEWKFIEKGHNPKMKISENQLFRIDTDPNEKTNVIDQYPKLAAEFLEFVKPYDALKPVIPMPDYGEGQEGFVAPREWKVEN
ncbi:MAG: arylsulfatase [Paludibacter sp.]|nr:MAG: arylsulfatase [Paludibacter sp.]MEA4981944.1 arylsulfatase [Paludibacter sp.]